jgi:hypothetical protein
LLHLALGGRGTLLLRRRGGSWSLFVSASLLLRLTLRSRWRALLGCGRPAGALLVLLPGSAFLRRCLPTLRLIVLLNYGVLRLVAVILALQRHLLLWSRIALP